MKKMVRKYQYLKNFLYNGSKILMLETTRKKKASPQPEKTVFIMTEKSLHVGICKNQKEETELCVLWHEPFMQWKDYSHYFPKEKVRIVNVIPKSREVEKLNSDDIASELSYYIEKKEISSEICLIGFKNQGAIMYDVARKLNRKVTIVTAFTDFEKYDKEAVSEEVTHIAFCYNNENWPKGRKADFCYIPRHKKYFCLEDVLSDYVSYI